MLKGEAAFVLPVFGNVGYITITGGDQFGLIDLVASAEFNNFPHDDWMQNKALLTRHFTI